MKIDFNNYEEWAIDYIDGNLSTDIKCSFDHFLAQHPEVKSNIDSLIECMPTLDCSTVAYPNKESLMRVGMALTLRSFIQYFAGAAVAAVLLFGLFMLTDQSETATALVADVADVADVPQAGKRVKEDIKQPATTVLELLEPLTLATTIKVESAPATKNATESESTISSDLEQVFRDGVLLSSSDFEPLADKYSTIGSDMDLSTPTTLAYISDTEMIHAKVPTDSFSDHLRQSLASIIAPIDRLSPIKIYRTQTSHGIEIASRYRIGRE